MLAKVITLHFDSMAGAFMDAPLREFIKDKKTIRMHEYFFQVQGTPYLAVFVTYENTAMETPMPAREKEENWREQIGENELPLFNAMRDWRKQRCKQDGIPPYVICTNKTLASLVLTRPKNLTELKEIEGFGDAKIAKYGKEIIQILTKSGEP